MSTRETAKRLASVSKLQELLPPAAHMVPTLSSSALILPSLFQFPLPFEASHYPSRNAQSTFPSGVFVLIKKKDFPGPQLITKHVSSFILWREGRAGSAAQTWWDCPTCSLNGVPLGSSMQREAMKIVKTIFLILIFYFFKRQRKWEREKR